MACELAISLTSSPTLAATPTRTRKVTGPMRATFIFIIIALSGLGCSDSSRPANPMAAPGGGAARGADGTPANSTAPEMSGMPSGGTEPASNEAMGSLPIAGGPTAPSTGGAGVTAMTPRIDQTFNLDWKYVEGDEAGADAAAHDDSAWTFVDVPHSTKFVTPEDVTAYLGVSWYRKHFSVPADHEGRKIFVTFDAAMQAADVWVNGVAVARHEGGYTPFTIDLTSAITYGEADNVIAVRVDSRANANWAPGWDGVDFQYHGGLYRNVRLSVTSPLHVTDAVHANRVAGGGVFITTRSIDVEAATLDVKTHVLNEFSTAKDATLLSELVDASGQVVASAETAAPIEAGAGFDFIQSLTVTSPRLWHPNTPVLYTLRTSLKDGETTVDALATRTGIRRIEWTHDQGLVINGTAFQSFGTNLHQEMFGLGNAVPDSAVYHDVKRVRDAGMTFLRGAHYPHSPAFYDACDELGVLVLNAQTGWQRYIDTSAFRDSTFRELRDMIRRDRNHPSVVAWEASLNESGFPDDWAQQAHSIVHEEYPGDQAYSAAWMWSRADIFIEASQHAVRETTDPRPIIIIEYGDWDYGGAESTSRQAREAGDIAMLTQANNVEDGTSLNLGVPWYSTSGYWDFADYGGFTNYGLTRCGLVDMYRLPKFSYYFMQSQRDPNLIVDGISSGPMVYIANHWTPTSPTTVRVYGNCDEVTLSLDGTPIATREPDAGTNLPHPPFNFDLGAFTPGELRADCRIGDAVVATFSRRTPGAEAAIVLRPEATTLRADASDARLVFIDVVDANGTVVPTNEARVNLSLSGPGSIVGPTTIGLKGGQLATWVRATRATGPLTLEASAPGLASASVELLSEAVPGIPPAPAGRD
jgi:hypothetical protein